MMMIFCLCIVSGCQKAVLKAPRLKEEQQGSQKTYTVQPMDITNINTVDGFVEGVRECAVAKTSGVIKEVYKHLGDSVKKGDVIATVASEELQNEYDSLREQVDSEKTQHQSQLKVYQLQKKKKEKELHHAKQKELCKAQISEIEHRISYENQRYQIAAEQDEETLKKLEKKLKKNNIVAPCNGQVGYFIGNAMPGSQIEENMPVVVVYNEDKKVVVYASETYKELEEFTDISVRIQDKEYPVKEYSYTAKEKKNLIKGNLKTYPCYTFDGIEKLETATAGVLIARGEEKKQVLAVPKAAIKQDREEKFVYIQREGTSQRVTIQTGEQNNYYTEVTAGLQQGDVITYVEYDELMLRLQTMEQETQEEGEDIPQVKEVQPVLGDCDYTYVENGAYDGFQPYESCQIVDEQEGTVFQKLVVKDGDMVEKGDVIAYVDHGVKASEKIAAANALTQARQAVNAQNQSYRQQLSQYEKEKKKAKSQFEKGQVQYDIDILKAEHAVAMKAANLEVSRASKEQQELEEKASGVVRATMSGLVSSCCGNKKGEIIDSNTVLCQITNQDTLYFQSFWSFGLHQGMKVKMVTDENKTYSGTVVYAGNDICKSNEDGDEEGEIDPYSCYIKPDKKVPEDAEIVRLEHTQKEVTGVLVIPGDACNKTYHYTVQGGETNPIDNMDYTADYNVLRKKQDGTYVLQSIQAHGSYNNQYWILSGLDEKDTVVYLEYPEFSDEVTVY